MVLDPSNEFNVDRTLTKDDVQKLIRVCLNVYYIAMNITITQVTCREIFSMQFAKQWKKNLLSG